MNQTIAITPRWQIHLPVKFRQVLGLTAPGLVEVRVVNKELILKPKASLLLKLAGKYQRQASTKKVNLDKIRDQIDYSEL